MLPYAVTIFLGAFLLFQIQPAIAKAILPWFGGSAAVWTACMLFFQVVLLLGYVYSHLLVTRLRPRWQAAAHITVLGASLLVLPIVPNAKLAAAAGRPELSILLLLAAAIGLPYFALSATSPLLQAWYARNYRLYAVSNAASLLGLFAYPFAIEPLAGTRVQLNAWSIAYAVFAIACGAVAIQTARTVRPDPKPAPPAPVARSSGMLWIALTATATALLIAVTNHLCQDIAPVPLLWVFPLGVYLLSLVLTFRSDAWYRPAFFRPALAPALAVMILLASKPMALSMTAGVLVFLAGLFIACAFCHGELVRLKPDARRLTAFYFATALGGALGGVYAGLIAPAVYSFYAELPVSLAACALLAVCVSRRENSTARAAITCAWIVAVAVFFTAAPRLMDSRVVRFRNFYGAFRVVEDGKMRKLFSGTTLHGSQFLAADRRMQPTTYYGPASAIGMILRSAGPPRRVGVAGLGVGTLAAYGRTLDYFRFYEINPLVVQAARSRFTFLRDCRARYDTVVGDARLSLEREEPQNFDVLALDAFSGDSVPVHLLTVEAFRVYLRHLRPGGVLAIHISNRHLDLEPIVAGACERLGKRLSIVRSTQDEPGSELAVWAVVSGSAAPAPLRFSAWTDDYSNLLEAIRR
ncbi:MAG: spermidine synthase [Acidobacteriota bacterium]